MRYIQCPTSFFFQYATPYGRLFRKGEQPIHLLIGNDLHEFFDEFNRGHDIKAIETMLCKEEVYATNINGFYKILTHYNLERAIESESKFYAENLKFVGYVDAIYELNDETVDIIKMEMESKGKKVKSYPDGKLAIIDYKTGKYHEYLHRKYIKELNLYVMLYESCTDKKIDYVGMFFTSQSENSFIEPVNKRLLGNDIKDFAKQKQNIRDHKFQRKHSQLCNWCDFKNLCDDYTDEFVREDKKKIYS